MIRLLRFKMEDLYLKDNGSGYYWAVFILSRNVVE